MTVRYRVLLQPELGDSSGNTVHVGLDVEYGDELAPLVFDGLPRRIEQVRKLLHGAPGEFGRPFDVRYKTTARELAMLMASPELRLHDPKLVDGEEVLARSRRANV